LDIKNFESYNVRIDLDRVGCRGPIFSVYIDEATENDDVEIINDITFIMEKTLLQEYGGFIIVSSDENNGKGLGMKPVVTMSSGCNGCEGCGSHSC